MENEQNFTKTVRDEIYYCYANLAMAHTAVTKKQTVYESFNFMIRAKLLKGLKNGTMNMHSIFDDEKINYKPVKFVIIVAQMKN